MTFSVLFTSNALIGQACDCSLYPTYKCISFGTLPDLIASGDLLDYAQAETQPQNIVVESFINFQDAGNSEPYKFAPGSNIVMLENAALDIRKEVIFDATYFFSGCNKPWTGINVYNSGTLRVTNGSVIENACHAIKLNPFSKVEVSSTIFLDNGICIEATGNVQTIGEGIAHNTFNGFDYIASQCNLNVRWAIILNDVPQITIGNLSGTGAPNRFIAYNGISADNTNLEVFNTMFEDLPSGTGIRLRGTGGVYSAQISGFGNAPSDPVFIKNYSIGVSSQNYNLTIQDAYFNGAGMQQISINNGQLPTRLVLTKNRFDQFEQDAVTVSLSTLREVNVAENEFYDDNSSVQGLEKTGIRWSNNQMATPAATGIIRENLFYDEAKTSSDPVFFQFTSIGVYVNGASQLGIKKNYFYQNYDSDIDHNFSGIQLNNASENELVENSTTGNHGPLTATNPGFAYHGIQLRESPKNFLSCNQSQNLNRGIAFHGPACDKTNFVQNIMEDNHTGLYLAPGTIMGVQAIRENKWEGDLPTGGIAEAHFDGTPGLGLLQMSLFQINSSNTNSSFWATPRIPASGWFLFAGTQVALAYSCLQDAEPFPPKSEAESMLIGGGFENYKDYPASGWEMSLSAFGVLAEYPELRPANSPEESFYETHISGNVGKLQRARMTWDDIALFSTSLEAGWASNTADIDQKLGAIKTETLAMEAASTPAEQVQIAATLEALKTELESLLQTNQSLSAQYQSDVSAKANDLAADLAEINATEDWENNLKTVLQLSVERLLAGTGEWTTTQQTTLESIADQCRHEGGIGVVLARSAIEKFDYDDEAMCPGWVDERTAPGAALNASIFPNPANTVCRISFKEPVRGTLHIRNMQGLMVQSLTLADVPTVTINTEKWPAGLYVVSAIADSGVRFTSKIAISH